MADCNHSCTITGIGIRIDIPSNQDGITPMDSRADKIYHLLSLRNREGSNVQHLNLEFEDDDSLALVPRVLESVHRYSRDGQGQNSVHPLTIMYEILRSWKMPELHENSGVSNPNNSMVSSMENFLREHEGAIQQITERTVDRVESRLRQLQQLGEDDRRETTSANQNSDDGSDEDM